MWVLSPMIGTASQHAAEEGALQNPVQFLVSGAISIGRPAKKGGTTGKADLLIFGESSVSALHAMLTVEPWRGGAHGAVHIADDSKYGTFVKKQQQGATEQRIPTKQPFQLQQGDILRFGTKCRYKLQQVALNICVTGRATADAELAAAAAKCNARLVECCSGGAATHCIATDQDVLTPAALYSLVNKIPVVTPQWLTTVAAGKVYANELQDTEPYTPKQLLLPGLQDKQQQQRRVLDVLKWQMPSNELLTNYHLVLPRGRQEDLAQTAKHFTQYVLMKNSPLSHSQLAAEEQQAATIGRAAVLVMPGADEAANAASAAADGAIAAISEQQLLCVLAIGDASMVQAAVDAFRQRQQQLQAPATGAAAAADSEDLTEVDDGDEGVVDEDESQLQAVIPVVHGRKQQQRTPGKHGKGKSPAKSPAVKQPLQLQTSTPNRSRASKRAAAAMEPAATQAPAAAPASAPAAPAAAADKTPPGRKRRKTAAIATSHDELEFVEDAEHQAAPLQAAADAAASAGPWHSNSVPAGQQQLLQQQQKQQPGAAESSTGPADPPPAVAGLPQLQQGIYVASLVVVQPPPAAAAVAAGASAAPTVNFKAFRRKENLPGYPSAAQQQADGHQQQQLPAIVVPIEPFDAAPKGLNVDAFLKDERARLDRLKKADELFNANLKPKAVAKSTGAGAAAAKPLTAKRKR